MLTWKQRLFTQNAPKGLFSFVTLCKTTSATGTTKLFTDLNQLSCKTKLKLKLRQANIFLSMPCYLTIFLWCPLALFYNFHFCHVSPKGFPLSSCFCFTPLCQLPGKKQKIFYAYTNKWKIMLQLCLLTLLTAHLYHSPFHKGGCGKKSKTSNKIISVLPQYKYLTLQFFQLYFNVFFALRSSTFVAFIAMWLTEPHKSLRFPYFCLVFSCLAFLVNRRLGNKHTVFVLFHLYLRFFQQISYIF